jgi:YVTN family beta-propeller protein
MHSTQSTYKPMSRGTRWARKCSGRGLLALSVAEGSLAPLVLVMGLFLLACNVTAQTPSPALLILEKSDTMLAIADPATLKIVARVPSGPDPHEVIATPDGKFAYITNYGGGGRGAYHTISVVDLSARKALPAIELGVLHGAHGIDFAGNKVYFTAEVNKAIGSIDPSDAKVDWVLGTGQNSTHMVVVNKDVSRIFTSNIGSDCITIMEANGSGNWNETPVTVGKAPEGFDVSPDGKEVWAANSGDGSVSIIDVASKKVVGNIVIGTKRSNRLKFTPDGKLVFVSDLAGSDLVILDAAARKEVKRLKLGHGAAGILMQPDGARAFVAASPDNQVFVIDLKSLEVAGQIPTGKSPDGLAWAQSK